MGYRDIAISDLREIVRLDYDAGLLYWLPRGERFFADGARRADWRAAVWNARFAGREAVGSVSIYGYKAGTILGFAVKAHCVVFAISSGYWPEAQIDHANGNRSDNRPSNLREASNLENARNQKVFVTNTSGHRGVTWNKAEGKWKARIGGGPQRRHLGTFDSITDAVSARLKAEAELGYYPARAADGLEASK